MTLMLTSVSDGSPINPVVTSSIFDLGAESIGSETKILPSSLGRENGIRDLSSTGIYVDCPTAVESKTIINDLRVLRTVSGGFST